MIGEQRGLVLRSQPQTWGDTNALDLKLDFLEQANKRMVAPCIQKIVVHFEGSLTGKSGDHEGADGYKLLGRFTARDGGGEIHNLPGSIMRMVEQMESGGRQFDNAQLASGTTDANYNAWWTIDYAPYFAKRSADTTLPVPFLTDGGDITLYHDEPVNATVNSGKFRVYAFVRDERVRQVKSRMIWSERNVSQEEDTYKIGGFLRYAFVASDLPTAEGYTALARDTYATVESRDLDYNTLDTEVLEKAYRMSRPDFSSNDEVIANNVLPLVWPRVNQRIGRMIDLESLHLNLNNSTAITGGKMVTCHLANRVGTQSAAWMGFASTADYVEALKERGQISGSGGARRAWKYWDTDLARKLPIDIPSL